MIMTHAGGLKAEKLAEQGPPPLGNHPLGTTRRYRPTAYVRFGKRCLDAVTAAVGLLTAAPVILLCAVAIRLSSRGPVFFRQTRVGQHGEPFQIIKLRTMTWNADKKGPGITASDDPRVTAVGKWLRKTKIDEIPQLLNVLRGEMSLVGPRPELPEYVAYYSPEQRGVLELKPGMTGPASLAFVDEERLLGGRTEKEHFYVNTVMVRKLELDLAYCRDVSFFKDCRLILRTARLVVLPTGSRGGGTGGA